MDDCNEPLPHHAQEGLRLFNEGLYFEAHEALELAWRAETRPVRDLYRGILQAAVVYLHMRRGNFNGAVKVGERCMRILDSIPAVCRGVRVDILRADLSHALAPCPPGWDFDPQLEVEVGRLAVKTGMFPLREYVDGAIVHTRVPHPRAPVDEYLKLQGRFAHLFAPSRNEPLIAEIQCRVDAYWDGIA